MTTLERCGWSVSLVVAVSGLVASCNPESADPATAGGTLVRAVAGGTVSLGEDVTLVIPPGSLAEDTQIAIEADRAVAGEADGFTPLGAAFRFSPPGTQFELGKPAILRMKFDPTSLAAMQLDGRTLELAYYDESLERYFSIGGEVDWTTATITARVEHFTLYLPMAAALAIGNNAPTVALQATVPTTIRSGAPVYVRATIRDYDVGGSIAGAQLEYRQVGSGSFTSVAMRPETTLDTFAAMIPSGGFAVGPGNDLEYRVTARDNLGASATSATVQVDVTRSYTAGSLSLTPGTQAIAAGFDKLFAVKGVDDLATSFALVPESASATRGAVVTSTAGVTFSARTVGTGQVQVRVGGDSAMATVNVSNGSLDTVSILDSFGQPIQGTLVVGEGARIELDAVGHDAWGNQVLITPSWTADPNIGAFVSDGLLDTLDGGAVAGFNPNGAVAARIGDVVGTQWVHVNARVWETSITFSQPGHQFSIDAMTTRNGVPYIAYRDQDASGFTARVAHFDGTGWISDGTPTPAPVDMNSLAIGAGTSRLQVAWRDGALTYTAHLEGTTWVQDGGALTVDPGNASTTGTSWRDISIAFDGDIPWIAWTELANGRYSVYVRRWNGTSWVLAGGNVDGSLAGSAEPSLAIHNGVPYIAFNEFGAGHQRVYVSRFDGASWELVGGILSMNSTLAAQQPQLVFAGDKPTVAFGQVTVSGMHYGLYVKQWDGTSWQLLGGERNDGGYRSVLGWALVADGDAPYLAFIESNGATLARRAEHFNPRTGVWTSLGAWGFSGAGTISMTMAGHTPYFSNQNIDSSISVLGLTR